MRKEAIFLFFIFAIIINFSFISASFTVGNLSHSITTAYSPGDFIGGWINISLQNEPSTSLFKTGFGNSITLIDLLNKNPGFSFSCNPSCGGGYSLISDSGSDTKDFMLNANQEQTFGFNLVGDPFSSVTGFFLNITSNVPEANIPQLYIDILNDKSIEWKAYNASGNFRDKSYGCYNNIPEGQTLIATGNKFCEKITIPIAPGVDLGATIHQYATSPPANPQFKMSIDDGQGRTAYCTALANTAITDQDINCPLIIPISQQQEFSVCIEPIGSAAGVYKIDYETIAPVCGYSVTTSGTIPYDFNIFAKAATYAPITNFPLNDAEVQKSTGATSIEQAITQYINNNYQMNCSKGCVIPIRFISNSTQELILSDLQVSYTAGGLTPLPVTTLYNLTAVNPTISSGYGKIFLDNANFSIPNSTGTSILTLTLADSQIFSDSINIGTVPKVTSINPLITIAGYPTNFSIMTSNLNASISGYKWNFGDGTSETSSGKNIVHTYDTLGNFNLNVTILGNGNQSFSTSLFAIQVNSPKDAINSILSQKMAGLNSTEMKIKTYPQFYQASLNSALDIPNLEKGIGTIILKNNSASSDADYIAILGDLISLKIPDTIVLTKDIESAPLYPDSNNINLDVLKTIGSNSIGTNKEDYINAIIAWDLENLDAKINFNEFSAVYGGSTEQILYGVQIDASKKTTLDYNPYLVIKKTENLKFDKNYNQKESNGYYYIELANQDNAVSFSTTENLNFTNIPAFISPEIKQLPVIGTIAEIKPVNIIGTLILVFLVLFVFAFIIYLLLQEWYKKRYENFLFRNKNDLYNLVTYIQNAKKAGTPEKDIAEKLKKAGWKAEQITYIMRKYVGKRTGLIEIPIGKLFSRFKSKKPEK